MAYARDARWAQSEKSFRRALELEPNFPQTYIDYAFWLLLPLGRTDEALKMMHRGERADPVSSGVQEVLGMVLISARKYDEAVAHCSHNVECLSRARLGQGRVDDAIRILAPNKNTFYQGYLGYVYARAGRRQEAEKLIAGVAPNAFSQALIYAGLSDKDRTLEALERVAGLGAVQIGRALNSPEFAFIRDDPRVNALRKSVGLPVDE
jgi:tetratricopeptide (TPR) repeat protein